MNIFDEAIQRYLEESGQYSANINNLEKSHEENNHEIAKIKTSMLTSVVSIKNKLILSLMFGGLIIVALSKLIEVSSSILIGSSVGIMYFIGSLTKDIILDYKNKKANRTKEIEVRRLEEENEKIKSEILELRAKRQEKIEYSRILQQEKVKAALDLLEEYYPYKSKEHSDRILMKLLKRQIDN